ncbi:uncharacterized protein [Euphorbia lathyris]|uniref:uncharacterized protein n=1 Tax=Euphorbia lathyris TaxID=212925 RepID=UPI003313812B
MNSSISKGEIRYAVRIRKNGSGIHGWVQMFHSIPNFLSDSFKQELPTWQGWDKLVKENELKEGSILVFNLLGLLAVWRKSHNNLKFKFLLPNLKFMRETLMWYVMLSERILKASLEFLQLGKKGIMKNQWPNRPNLRSNCTLILCCDPPFLNEDL